MQILNINYKSLSMQTSQIDQIRKVRVNYLKCKQGHLHEGQVLNFICVDQKCKSKGLICSVCQTTNHKGHQAVHLKIFLSEIHKSLSGLGQDKSQSLSLNDQLRNIQNSKKQMEKTLYEMVKQVSEKVKQTQQKINNSYIALRKILLLQSTASNKLPQLYKLLTEDVQDEQFVINQLKNLSQFIEYKNNKIYTIDNAHKLMEEYAKTASSISIHLSTIIPEISGKLATLPLKIKTLSTGLNQNQQSSTYKFSDIHRAQSIQIINQKQAYVKDQYLGGLIFIDSSSNGPIQKISFKIKKCPSFSILLGVGNPEISQGKSYIMDQENFELSAISSVGFPLNDYDNPSFVYGQGDIIDVVWDRDEVKLSFSRRNGIQKFDLFPMIQNGFQKQQFFVGMTAKDDCVQIVD